MYKSTWVYEINEVFIGIFKTVYSFFSKANSVILKINYANALSQVLVIS